MKRLSLVIGVSILMMLAGCDFFEKSSKEVVVAECYGKYLYESDLEGIVPKGASIMDSIQRVSTFIDSWVKRQVLLHQAENNLDKEEPPYPSPSCRTSSPRKPSSTYHFPMSTAGRSA